MLTHKPATPSNRFVYLPLKRRARPGGFALVIALGLMAFILLLLLALSTFVSVETSSASAALLREKAQQNALLGIKVALGELQKHVGPDQRVTARGEILMKELGAAEPLTPSTDGRAMWVGVVPNDMPSFENQSAVKWLVSGVDSNTHAIEAGRRKVTIVAEGEYDVDFFDATGKASRAQGAVIEAGVVELENGRGVEGGYAWIVDDEGMKGKLRMRAPDNEDALFATGAVLPGNYNPARLSGLNDFSGEPARLGSAFNLAGLSFFEVDIEDLHKHRFDYTLNSYGVLSDARNGGLRGDLSVALEDDATFNAYFDGGDLLLIDPQKLAQAGELSDNDYISWKIFRDYYRLKDRLRADGVPLDGASFTLGDADYVGAYTNHGVYRSGPHAFHRYGTWPFAFVNNNQVTYNPVKPILAFFSFRTWVDVAVEADEAGESRLVARAYVSPFFGAYNPYNVTLRIPQVRFAMPQNIAVRLTDATGKVVDLKDWYWNRRDSAVVDIDNVDGWLPIIRIGVGEDDTRFQSSSTDHRIRPGEIAVFTANVAHSLDSTEGSTGSFGNVLTMQLNDAGIYGVYRTFTAPDANYTPPFTVEVQTYLPESETSRPFFVMARPNYQPYQWMAFPYIYDAVETYRNSSVFPGKRIVIEGVDWSSTSPSAANYNNAAEFGMWLRTTREPIGGLRPLIDGNVRAAFVNPRWDHNPYDGAMNGLGLRTPVTYSAAPLALNAAGLIDTKEPGGFNLWGIYGADTGNPTGPAFPEFTIDIGNRMVGYWGGGVGSVDGEQFVVLFDVPRAPLVSLGQLQHAEAGHFSYEPSYIVGNSYANVRIPLDDWRSSARDTFSSWEDAGNSMRINGNFDLYDASYLVNEVLWDRYIFSTIPLGSPTTEYRAFLDGSEQLPNPRYIPYEPSGFTFTQETLNADLQRAYQRNAGLLLVDGGFNVNSTSVSAWEAFLSSTAGLPVARLNPELGTLSGVWEPTEARFPRVQSSAGGQSDFFTGYEELDPAAVRRLAEAIVHEIRSRGVFRSLGEFVNRWDPQDSSIPAQDERRKSGALQAALDRAINKDISAGHSQNLGTSFPAIPADAQQAAAFSGHILQGDILQSLAPYMSVRSDTFRIRAVGQVNHPVSGEVQAEAWCEVVVQRLPDPVLTNDTASNHDRLVNPASEFGRRFEIVSFRWLERDEI